jgi:Holliday junction resolvase RusA-like endonuclease
MPARSLPGATEVAFEAPGRLLNLNDRMHWAQKMRLVRSWRDAAHWAAASQLGTPAERRRGRSLVTVTLPVTRMSTRRDPHNFVATVKPIIDGLVDAGIWPDDNAGWVATNEPRFARGTTVTVSITPLEEHQ